MKILELFRKSSRPVDRLTSLKQHMRANPSTWQHDMQLHPRHTRWVNAALQFPEDPDAAKYLYAWAAELYFMLCTRRFRADANAQRLNSNMATAGERSVLVFTIALDQQRCRALEEDLAHIEHVLGNTEERLAN